MIGMHNAVADSLRMAREASEPLRGVHLDHANRLSRTFPLPGPKSGVRRCVQVRSIGGAEAAMRCALADDRIACFKKTMNSQEFMDEERKAITGQRDPKQ